MLNINRKFVILTSGALLAACFNLSHASNVYNGTTTQAAELETAASTPRYWACPAQYRICPSDAPVVTAQADQAVQTDATVSDVPARPTWYLGDWSQYYDFGRIMMLD